jgi:hypothetical protein
VGEGWVSAWGEESVKYDWTRIPAWLHDLMVEHAEDMAKQALQTKKESERILAGKDRFKLILENGVKK